MIHELHIFTWQVPMLSVVLLLLTSFPGWSGAYVAPAPLSRHPRSALGDQPQGTSSAGAGGAVAPPAHAQRCRPLFRKGFSKGGMGKQGELMELMAKAKRDRLKKELEEKLKESGDLPPDGGEPGKPAVASGGARIKPERSWREAGAAKDGGTTAGAASSAKLVTSAGPAAPTVPDSKQRAPAGPGGKVWPSTQDKGRSGDPAYTMYDQLLEDTGSGDGKESRFLPEVENPQASFAEYNALRDKAQWDAVVAGKVPVANRSPLASESEYSDFEAMLTEGVRVSPDNLGPKAAEKKLLKRAEKQLPQAFSTGDFAPLDPWRLLTDSEGNKPGMSMEEKQILRLPMPRVDASQVNFGLFQGEKPLLVVADPSPGSTEMRETMYELNTRMPRKLVDVVAVTTDSPGSNRKSAKKSRLTFPVLSDEGGDWMLAYRVIVGGQRDKMAFLIEPELGRIENVWSNFDALSLVDMVKDYMSSKR